MPDSCPEYPSSLPQNNNNTPQPKGTPTLLTWSLVDRHGGITNPDTRAFPLFATVGKGTARPTLEVDVRRGECLVVPAGWGHKVTTPEPTLMFSYWALGKPFGFGTRSSPFYDDTDGRMLSSVLKT